ncbi:hypothetical protein F442_22946 [Phytophthora nicotianae P10297]|uniref:Uncharacterized protein n=1 Tax=Phytophthora nicotianae P10297 TaxID=1317064 RepID=W2XZ62_PHYNI|nr:hypothetical protein F442_22946 [Phytophthora nicotianae P10297]
MASMNVDQSVAEYVGVDEDIDVNEPPEEVQTEEGSNSEGGSGDEGDIPPVSASTARACCVELSSFLFHCQGDTQREQDMVQTLTKLTRSQVVQRRRQTSLHSFFQQAE